MISWGNIVWTVGFGLGQGGTWRWVTTFSIALWCLPVNWFLTSVWTDSITHNAQAAIEYSCSMSCLHLFQCQVIWRANDMVALLCVCASSSLSSSSVPLLTGGASSKTISFSSFLCYYWCWIPEQCFPLQSSSGWYLGFQKVFHHSSHPVNFLLLPWFCVISSKFSPCKACLNCSTEELWVQEIHPKVGCTCTSKSCCHLYLELPPWHCWSESDLKISVDEWWPSMVAEDEEVESWHKTIEPFKYQHLGWGTLSDLCWPMLIVPWIEHRLHGLRQIQTHYISCTFWESKPDKDRRWVLDWKKFNKNAG